MVMVRPKATDVLSLRLSPEEGFVLSRVDGPLSMKDLVMLTGLDETRVAAIVERLVGEGAIEVEGPEPPPELEELGPADELEEIGPVDPEEAALLEPAEEAPEPAEEAPEPAEEAPEPAEDAHEEHRRDGEYRKLYETMFRHLEKDARIAAASSAEGAELLALCYDADPQVIHAVLTNPRVTLDHARLVASHHRSHAGLEMIGRHSAFLSDVQVQRRLLANPQLPEMVVTKIVHPKLLVDIYKISINREIPERARIKTRGLLQKKFMLASADERAALIMKTEARCLIQLSECALDARTTQILCGKSAYSILFIQNFARWSATPPQLLKHLLKQPVVRQSMGLRKMLLKHPNVPAEVKRSFV
jgi:hypothetical protein